METKVNEIETYNDTKEHIVCKGKLLLIQPQGFKIGHLVIVNGRQWAPIIVSENEKAELGEYIYHKGLNLVSIVESINDDNEDLHLESGDTLFASDCEKILALPENFSTKHLKDIVDGKLKNGDCVLIECENTHKDCDRNFCKEHGITACSGLCKSYLLSDIMNPKNIDIDKIEEYGNTCGWVPESYKIKLDKKLKVILYPRPIKTWEDVEAFMYEVWKEQGGLSNFEGFFTNSIEQYFNSPTKKTI